MTSQLFLEAQEYYINTHNSNFNQEEINSFIEKAEKKFYEALCSKLDFEEWILSKIYSANLLLNSPFLPETLNYIKINGMESNLRYIEAAKIYEEVFSYDLKTGFNFFASPYNRAIHLFVPDEIFFYNSLFLSEKKKEELGEERSKKIVSNYVEVILKKFYGPWKLFGNNILKTPWILPELNYYHAFFEKEPYCFGSLEWTVEECKERINVLDENNYFYKFYLELMNQALSLFEEWGGYECPSSKHSLKGL